MKTMKTKLIAVALVVSGAALAASPQQPQPQRGWQQQGQGGWQQASPEQRMAREQRKRMMQVVGLTETLGLSTQDALKLDAIIKSFDERRRPLKDQVRESARLLTEAAKGDNAALGQVDQATNRILDARIQLAALDKEMFQALSAGMNPQQRAKLALFYARLHKNMKGMRGEGSEGRFRPFRMRRQAGPFGEAVSPPSDPSAQAQMDDGSGDEQDR
jgi:hypothetical protein